MCAVPVELVFPVKGESVPVDHGYALFSALSRICPHIHRANNTSLHLIRGDYSGDGRLALSDRSAFRVRTAASHVSHYMALAGRSVELHGARVCIGIPHPHLLSPCKRLYAHIVVTRNGQDEGRFRGEISRQMRALNVKGELVVGKRRSLRVHGIQIVGYAVGIENLSPNDSLVLQEHGLGGKRKMGCGVFVPARTLS